MRKILHVDFSVVLVAVVVGRVPAHLACKACSLQGMSFSQDHGWQPWDLGMVYDASAVVVDVVDTAVVVAVAVGNTPFHHFHVCRYEMCQGETGLVDMGLVKDHGRPWVVSGKRYHYILDPHIQALGLHFRCLVEHSDSAHELRQRYFAQTLAARRQLC